MGMFRVEVVDTGVGISVDDQNRIFGEFTQFNKDELQGGGRSPWKLVDGITLIFSHCIGGSGLGLWISKRIVQLHQVVDRFFWVSYHKLCTTTLHSFGREIWWQNRPG